MLEHNLFVTIEKYIRVLDYNYEKYIYQVNNDIIRIRNFYQENGYKDAKIDYSIEYFSNKFELFNFCEFFSLTLKNV